MNEATLRNLLGAHNRHELLWAWICLAATVVLWTLAYLLVALFVVLITSVVFRACPHTWLVHLVTFGVMLILVRDGIKDTRELFDLMRFRESFYSFGAGRFNVMVSGSGVSVTRGNPLQAAWGISEFLLCAPRTTLAAIRHFRNRAAIEDARVRDAVTAFGRLAQTREWVPVKAFGPLAASLHYLDLADLLWTRVHGETAEVKLDPSARDRYAGG